MKEHFEKYNEIERQLKELRFKKASVEARLYGIGGISYDNSFRGTNPKDLKIILIEEKDWLIEQIKKLNKEKKELYNFHEKEIAKVGDEQKRSILRSTYLLDLKPKDIAQMLDVSINHVFKLKQSAIKEFKAKNFINDSK